MAAEIDQSIDLSSVSCTGSHAHIFFIAGRNIRLESMTRLLRSLDGQSSLERIYSFDPVSDVFVREDGQMLMIAFQRRDPSHILRLVKFEIANFHGETLLMETADHGIDLDLERRTFASSGFFECRW